MILFVLQDVSLTWNNLREPLHRYKNFSIESREWMNLGTVCSSLSIVQTHKWLNKKGVDIYPNALLQPGYRLSGELAFYYILDEKLASEEWYKELLSQSLRILFNMTSVHQLNSIDELQMLISFMFLSNTTKQDELTINFIDTILALPTTKTDMICRAYHLLMALLFSEIKDSDLNCLKNKIISIGGFPYVGWTNKGFMLLLIPYERLGQTLCLEIPSSINLMGTDFSSYNSKPITPIREFTMDIPQGIKDVFSKKIFSSFPEFTTLGNVTRIFGNAHLFILPNLPLSLAFQIKNTRGSWFDQEFQISQSVSLLKEIEIFNIHRGVPVTLKTHVLPSPLNDEMLYYMTLKTMTVKCIYKLDTFNDNFDPIESELDKLGYEVDIIYSSSVLSWVMRIGTTKNGYW
jgi:hypothetical protein